MRMASVFRHFNDARAYMETSPNKSFDIFDCAVEAAFMLGDSVVSYRIV
jgi:hypothetical protein